MQIIARDGLFALLHQWVTAASYSILPKDPCVNDTFLPFTASLGSANKDKESALHKHWVPENYQEK